MGYSMRTDRYRFTLWQHRDDPGKIDGVELYDHARDPEENINLAGDLACRDQVRELTAQLKAGWVVAQPRSLVFCCGND